jgi:hypothetical protein
MKTYAKWGAFLALLLMISCGQNNVTGKNDQTDYTGGVYGGNGGVQNALSTVMRENPCMMGGQRTVVQVQVNMQVDPQRLYVGMTSEGDVASLQGNQGGAVMTMHICTRPGTSQGQGQLMGNPVVGYSQICQVDEIKAANVAIPGQMGYYYLAFRPIAIPGVINNSPTLCRMM